MAYGPSDGFAWRILPGQIGMQSCLGRVSRLERSPRKIIDDGFSVRPKTVSGGDKISSKVFEGSVRNVIGHQPSTHTNRFFSYIHGLSNPSVFHLYVVFRRVGPTACVLKEMIGHRPPLCFMVLVCISDDSQCRHVAESQCVADGGSKSIPPPGVLNFEVAFANVGSRFIGRVVHFDIVLVHEMSDRVEIVDALHNQQLIVCHPIEDRYPCAVRFRAPPRSPSQPRSLQARCDADAVG